MDEDFDIDSLAKYLHLTPQQVTRLTDRGKLPGRRIAGAWRFSPAEIHHWLEERIGLSDDEELAEVETVLHHAADAEYPAPSVASLLPREAIEVPLVARTRNSVITKMTEVAGRTGLLWDPPKLAEAVRNREDMHPTALECGVALLHPRRPMPTILGQSLVAFGRTDQGIPFGGSRGVLTDLFFLILSVDDAGHLKTLARISRLINEPEFLSALKAAPDADEILKLVAERESEIEL